MVMQSNLNWKQHQIDVYNVVAREYSKAFADVFIKFYRKRYNEHDRAYIHWRLAVMLMQDYADTKLENGSRFYGFFGPGGSGKSTLAMNIFYFLDPLFHHKHLHRKLEHFVEDTLSFPPIKALRAVGLDEPDNTHHPNSPVTKKVRELFGEMRQQWLFTGVCATDLADVQGFWWKKFTGIFFVKKISPVRGRAWFFRDDPHRKTYPVQWIKRYWHEKMYNAFEEAIFKFNAPSFDTMKHLPFPENEATEYLKDKAENFRRTGEEALQLFKNEKDKAKVKPQWKQKRDMVIYKEYKSGTKQTEIANKYGLTQAMVSKICTEMGQL